MGSENEWLGGCVRVQLTSNDRQKTDKITFAMSCSPGSPAFAWAIAEAGIGKCIRQPFRR
jgi:hypothetical protein